MAKFELKLPKMGESVAEATLTAWLKDVGDKIDADEPVLEIATDKVDSEVPSEVEGVLIQKLFEVDDVIEVAVSEPTIISGVPVNPVAFPVTPPVNVPTNEFAVIVPLELILPEAVTFPVNVGEVNIVAFDSLVTLP